MILSNDRFGRSAGAWVLALFMVVFVAFAAAADDGDEKQDGWTGDAALSVSAQSGTVDTFAGTVEAGAQRAWSKDAVEVRFTGAYGTSRDRKNDPENEDTKEKTVQDSQRLKGDWKHTIHDRWFWDSGTVAARDSTQDLEVRFRLTTGPGYRFWEGEDKEKKHFDVTVGVGYRYELYDGNTGPSTNSDTPGDLVADNGSDKQLADMIASFEYKNLLFDGKIEWSHTGSAAMPANDPNSYIITSEAVAGVPLTEAWSFRTGLFYEYVNEVPDDVNPSTFRVTLGLGYKF